MAKISCQSKKLWVTEKHSSRRSFSHRCGFCSFSCSFQGISKPFCNHNESIQWIFFSPMCLCINFESFCSIIFFHLSRFRNQISPPNVFLGKFQHPFSTLKHYDLAIYVAKWLQILYMSSTTCTLQDCTVEICIT